MADFDKAVKVVLKNEGKYNADPHDAAFATNYGISLRFLLLSGIDLNADNTIDIKDILSLTPFEAKRIYKARWWDNYGYGDINSQSIATKIFDLAVNMGPLQAHKIAQTSINNIREANSKIDFQSVDGILGSRSKGAINYIVSVNKESRLLNAIKAEAVRFYTNIADKNPKLQMFKKGWLRRAEG